MCNSISQNVGHFVTQKKDLILKNWVVCDIANKKTVASRSRVGVKKGVARNRTTKKLVVQSTLFFVKFIT